MEEYQTTEKIINEPVLFQIDLKDEASIQGTLLSCPTKIINLQIWTEEGYRDILEFHKLRWEIQDHIIKIKYPPKQLPYIRPTDLILPLNAPNSYPATQNGKMGLLHSETGLWHQKQVLITYETPHNSLKEIIESVIPTNNSRKEIFPSMKRKLLNEEPLEIFIIGDSITAGANASILMNLAPHQQAYPNLFVEYLKENYKKKNIRFVNAAKGGMASKWGKMEIKKQITDLKQFKFDLVIIAWGANDAGGKVPAWKYIRNIASQIKSIQQINPDAEFILISTSLPNKLWRSSNHPFIFEYQKKLKKYSERNNQKCLLADITKIWKEILQFKSYYDITGNGLNHPNDYAHRIYAEVLFRLVVKNISSSKNGT